MITIPSPNDTGLLRITPANQYAAMDGGEIGPEPFVVYAFHVDEASKPKTGLDALLKAIRKPGVCKSDCLHTYLGGLNLADETDDSRFPFADLPIGRFSASELVQGGAYNAGQPPLCLADISQTAVRDKLVRLIVAETVRRRGEYGYTGLYADNFAHPSMDTPIKWADTIKYLTQLREALHSESLTLIANTAMALGHDALPTADVASIAQCVDGIGLELAANPNYVRTPTQLANLVKQWQELISRDVRVFVFDEHALKEARFYAALAMVLQGGYVWQPQEYDRQDWFAWPTLYGLPTGPIKQDGMTLSRKFGRVVVWADLDKRVGGAK